MEERYTWERRGSVRVEEGKEEKEGKGKEWFQGKDRESKVGKVRVTVIESVPVYTDVLFFALSISLSLPPSFSFSPSLLQIH